MRKGLEWRERWSERPGKEDRHGLREEKKEKSRERRGEREEKRERRERREEGKREKYGGAAREKVSLKLSLCVRTNTHTCKPSADLTDF